MIYRLKQNKMLLTFLPFTVQAYAHFTSSTFFFIVFEPSTSVRGEGLSLEECYIVFDNVSCSYEYVPSMMKYTCKIYVKIYSAASSLYYFNTSYIFTRSIKPVITRRIFVWCFYYYFFFNNFYDLRKLTKLVFVKRQHAVHVVDI